MSQDNAILSALVEEDKQTAYSISQSTNISIPQTVFRLNKLIELNVVIEEKDNDKTVYSIHPSLKSHDVVKKISVHIKKIVDLIDKEQYASPDGMKCIISFILSKTDIEDNIPNEEDERKVAEFRKELEEYAKQHELTITNIKGWTEGTIRWMALNDKKCHCVPGKRHCPCPEVLAETKHRGKCKCSVFVGKV